MNESTEYKDDDSPWCFDDPEKQELIQIAPNDLTKEQIDKILDHCRTDPMFFFRYVGIFNIEQTELLQTLVSRIATEQMCKQMFTLHDRRLKTKQNFSIEDLK